MGDLANFSNSWHVVFQTPERALVLYNSSLQQIRTVSQTSDPEVPISWSSPSYFQILADILSGNGPIPFSLGDFLMNGYFERFFPIRQIIGKGGCGCVYRVEHILAGIRLAEYAVKVIPVGEFAWLKKVISEVKLLEKLAQKPNPLILGYKHCWIEEWQTATFGPKIPCLFILMEYAPLGNLENLLMCDDGSGDFQEFSEEETWQMFLNIAVAVHHLHSLGIIHRDLKLSNVLIFEEKTNMPLPLRLVLSDFGTSIDTGFQMKQTARTGATGTIETMAPELLVQSSSGSYLYSHSFASDIWSLGVILFSLFYRKNPFTGDFGEKRLKEFTSVDELISELKLENVQVPPLVHMLLKKMMMRDPSKRCSIDEILGNPTIHEMVVKFGLETCLKNDGPRVFVVSPSMEDIQSSVLLALTDNSFMNEETQTDEITVKKAVKKTVKVDRNKIIMKMIMFLALMAQKPKSITYGITRALIYAFIILMISDDKILALTTIFGLLLETCLGLCKNSHVLMILNIFVCFVFLSGL
ncbi:putative protein kinase [Histomonas meleagridis]|uniref:putative protein kinase n=1 Tax=Histomonas meleagridis TaxID=135588 RepID=UPI00355A3659|nr:putative protein kinase [Histomonas meleagridis]KAH0800367.1 putative protein kinase [Histomonas meleagridis]